MERPEFLDFGQASDSFINISSLKISSQSWIQVSEADLPCMKTKENFNKVEDWEKKDIFKKGRYSKFKDTKGFYMQQEALSLNERKKKDLLKMLPYMDQKYHKCYQDICK
ncbi:hypothetical protein PR048_016441 [Dryococelus australis]|uniref:Uncharacterized protein n=1 Tax=Dryococelus australis TaxID=614101 RepID=A0ABQ9HJR4_9NEOP|nr:hypothetical protein PR048_016441 [Dryococelus australis]